MRSPLAFLDQLADEHERESAREQQLDGKAATGRSRDGRLTGAAGEPGEEVSENGSGETDRSSGRTGTRLSPRSPRAASSGAARDALERRPSTGVERVGQAAAAGRRRQTRAPSGAGPRLARRGPRRPEHELTGNGRSPPWRPTPTAVPKPLDDAHRPQAMTLGEHLARAAAPRGDLCALLRRRRPPWRSSSIRRSSHFLQAPYCRVAGPRHCQLYVTSPPLTGCPCASSWPPTGAVPGVAGASCGSCGASSHPGLHSNEKRYAVPFVWPRVVLFAGRGRAWRIVTFPHALRFLGRHRGSLAAADLRPQQVPGPHRGPHGGVRAHLRVPGRPGVARAGRRGLAGQAVVLAAVGHRAHRGLRGASSPRAATRSPCWRWRCRCTSSTRCRSSSASSCAVEGPSRGLRVTAGRRAPPLHRGRTAVGCRGAHGSCRAGLPPRPVPGDGLRRPRRGTARCSCRPRRARARRWWPTTPWPGRVARGRQAFYTTPAQGAVEPEVRRAGRGLRAPSGWAC